jgi:hypothetical protein
MDQECLTKLVYGSVRLSTSMCSDISTAGNSSRAADRPGRASGNAMVTRLCGVPGLRFGPGRQRRYVDRNRRGIGRGKSWDPGAGDPCSAISALKLAQMQHKSARALELAQFYSHIITKNSFWKYLVQRSDDASYATEKIRSAHPIRDVVYVRSDTSVRPALHSRQRIPTQARPVLRSRPGLAGRTMSPPSPLLQPIRATHGSGKGC